MKHVHECFITTLLLLVLSLACACQLVPFRVFSVVQFYKFIGFVCAARERDRERGRERRIRQKQICLLSLNAFCPLTSYTRCYCCCCFRLRRRRRWWWWCNCKSSLCVYVAHVRRWVISPGIKQHFCLHFTVAPEIWHTLVLKKKQQQQQQAAHSTGTTGYWIHKCVCLPMNFASSSSHTPALVVMRFIYYFVQHTHTQTRKLNGLSAG